MLNPKLLLTLLFSSITFTSFADNPPPVMPKGYGIFFTNNTHDPAETITVAAVALYGDQAKFGGWSKNITIAPGKTAMTDMPTFIGNNSGAINTIACADPNHAGSCPSNSPNYYGLMGTTDALPYTSSYNGQTYTMNPGVGLYTPMGTWHGNLGSNSILDITFTNHSTAPGCPNMASPNNHPAGCASVFTGSIRNYNT